ncbi:serine O-acetyltransferase [Actinokineospora pegani]|uniref:serine O-acetyltransferase n=1 Tax=Actinokineospora pegani TaxID=2654637 RepID=UPI0012EAA7B2|nr:serine O-acetyltransferase [Actinokineospora pegani]
MRVPQWTVLFLADLRSVTGGQRTGPVGAAWLVATRPGVLATLLMRLQGAADERVGAPLLRALNHLLTGADFEPGARIGPGLRLEHPNGLVVGARAVVGTNAFLCQRVTLGERLGDNRGPEHPVLGDNVFVGAGAAVLGSVRVGCGARIGAGAVVLHDVPAGAVAVGNPAVIARRRTPRSRPRSLV